MRRPRRDVPVVSREEAERNPDPDHARVVLPEEGPELDRFLDRIRSGRACGNCAHFDYEKGQEYLHTEGLHILRELDLQSIGHASDPRRIGVCRELSGGPEELFLTHADSPAQCPLRKLDSRCPRTRRDESVRCPYFRKRVGGRILRFFKRF